MWKSTKLLLVATLLQSHLCLAVRYQGSRSYGNDAFKSTSACFGEACELIQNEVEGLSRLKIIRTYVSETVRLLDSLMESMDEELVNLANKIKETGAENCPDLPSPLDYIAQPMQRGSSSALSAGIMEESIVSGRQDSQTYASSGGEGHGLEDLTSGIEQSNVDSREDDTWDGIRPANPGRSNAHHSNSGSHAGNSWSGQRSEGNSWQSHGSNTWSRDRENDIDSRERESWGSGSSSWDSRGSSSSGGFSSSSGSSESGWKKGRQLSSSSGGPIRPNSEISSSGWKPVGGGNCRGVIDSPFYVPGIDQWCKDNCSRGYCPATHCTCQ